MTEQAIAGELLASLALFLKKISRSDYINNPNQGGHNHCSVYTASYNLLAGNSMLPMKLMLDSVQASSKNMTSYAVCCGFYFDFESLSKNALIPVFLEIFSELNIFFFQIMPGFVRQ